MAEKRIRLNRIRRKRELRRHILLFMASACLIVILSVAGGCLISRAQTKDTVNCYKYFTSIQIQKGDTLWTLADRYADEHFKSRESFIREVMRTNHLTDDSLTAGDYLIIPYYSDEFRQ